MYTEQYNDKRWELNDIQISLCKNNSTKLACGRVCSSETSPQALQMRCH